MVKTEVKLNNFKSRVTENQKAFVFRGVINRISKSENLGDEHGFKKSEKNRHLT